MAGEGEEKCKRETDRERGEREEVKRNSTFLRCFRFSYPGLWGDGRSLTITSRVTDIKQRRLCGDLSQSCPQVFQSYEMQNYFIAGIENFEVCYSSVYFFYAI